MTDSPENLKQKVDPFEIKGVERKDLWVVTYWCPLGCSFDLFVAHKNLSLASIAPCIHHKDRSAWIHDSRPIR